MKWFSFIDYLYKIIHTINGRINIMVREHSYFDFIEILSAVTGWEIYSTFDSPKKVVLGTYEKVEEKMIGEDHVNKFIGCMNP